MKPRFTYNPETDTYIPVRHSRMRRLLAVASFVLVSIATGAALFVVYQKQYVSPREQQLAEENKQLNGRLKQMGRRLDTAIGVMNDICERDRNYYRTLLLTDSLPMLGTYGMSTVLGSDIDDAELAKTVDERLTTLEALLYSQTKEFDALRQQALSPGRDYRAMPAIVPVSYHDFTRLSSGFGLRIDPVYEVTRMHEGLDFAAPEGSPIYATAAGTVTYSGWKNGYGNCVDVDHGNSYSTRYGHMSQILVPMGAKVERGDLIGRVGSTGKSTGPHLHYEVRINGEAVNPIDYFFDDLTPAQYDMLVQRAATARRAMD